MHPILDLAHENHLTVIEDAAQAIGARYHDQSVGSFGDFGCFSFFPSKNLGGAGDGGLITTNSDVHAERLRMLRVHGSKKKYYHDILGTNSRLDALQAAILRVKLRHLDAWTAGRQNRAARYQDSFDELHLSSFIRSPEPSANGNRHVYNQFTICSLFRDGLKSFLQQDATEIYYPLCLHLQRAFSKLGYEPGDFPLAEKASTEALSLPVYPELTDEQQDRIITSIANFCAQEA